MCDDLISREAAIDALAALSQEHEYRIPGKRDTYSQYNEAWQDALDRAEVALYNLPSPPPEERWIPVTDHYPPPGEFVIVTDEYLGVTILRFIGAGLEDECVGEGWEDEYGQFYSKDSVSAWQPKPKPYKEEA